jgi:hypothetical protein
MATTTNYGWTTPDDTALVKDGASAIRSLGTSVDTTTKALNPSTTLGDIEYRSSTANTNTRLGIGTSGQVLSVSGGVPSWQTVSSGGMELISTTTLTGSSVTLSSIPQTYKDLQIICRLYLPATTNTALRLRFNADATANRHRTLTSYSETYQYAYNATNVTISGNARNSSSSTFVVANIYDYANTTTPKLGDSISIYTETDADFSSVRNHFAYSQTSAVSSLEFLPTAGNFTSGTILLYGVK